ncbi:MAG: rhamnulokinase [Planctomycetes bacterium]|nr:rhamnulokinase [Planctomycetota bacterium]
MAKQKRYLALDYGTRFGSAIAGGFDGEKLELDCLHRFTVDSTTMLGNRYWDFPAMIINAKAGLSAASHKYGPALSGVAVDSWGVDFGLLDKTGHLLSNPLHHLDLRTLEAMDKLHSLMPLRSVYQKTGIRARREGTLYQLHSMAAHNSPLLDKAVTMLLMADLVSYFLSGVPVQEYTLATTTGMYDAESRDWSRDIIMSARIPPVMVPEIVAPGSVVGPLLDEVAAECQLSGTPVIAPGSHAMAGAVAAVPASGEDWIYVVTNEWNRIGVELSAPLINDAAFAGDFSNEGGVDGTIRLLKGVMGMWMIFECFNVWEREDGAPLDREALLQQAHACQPLARIINPDDPQFVAEGPMPEQILSYLKQKNISPPESRGEMIRMCLDSQALAIRKAVEDTAALTGKKYSTVHLVGDESGSKFLAQLAADAIGIPVKAGPVQARAIGNLLMQAIALGDIASLAEGREIVARSFAIEEFTPSADRGKWDDAFAQYLAL